MEAPIARFLITANEIALGEFEGEDEAAAIEAFASEAGFDSYAGMRDSLGEDPENPWLHVVAQPADVNETDLTPANPANLSTRPT